VVNTPRSAAFQPYFAGASVPALVLLYLAVHDLLRAPSDADIAGRAPEDLLGLGLPGLLLVVAVPFVMWLLLFLRALAGVSSPLQRRLAVFQAFAVLASVIAIVLAYRSLEHRVLGGLRAGPLPPSASAWAAHESRAA
jgi:hypothetical protein